jgi:uncharacterized phage-associated protein
VPVRATAIANYFLDVANAAGAAVTPMKLQKLVYFSHGWNLAITEEPLINETVEAWRWGPVVPSLWGELKQYGSGPVSEKLTRLAKVSPFEFEVVEDTLESYDPPLSNDQIAFTNALLARMWEIYGGLSAVQLSNMTHEDGSPWDQVWKPMADNPIRRKDIPNDLIRDYFRARLPK